MSRDFVHSTGHLGSAFEFHISRKCRDKYRFDETIYSSTGNVVFPNFTATRRFAQAINAKRQPHEKKAQAGYINAMGLIDEIFHYVIDAYRQMKNPLVFRQALEFLEERVGREKVNELLKAFSEEFPVQSVYIRDISVEEYLAGTTAGIPNKLVVLEEMVVLWLANMNPAYKEYIELFEDLSLAEKTVYKAAVEHIIEFFKLQPEFGPDNTDLVTMLRSPAIVVPHSVFGQLRYILERWGFLLPARFKLLILSSMDMIKEEEKVFFDGKGEAQVPSFVSLMHEKEAFTPDRDWMPRLVLIAKNSYVWLWQLSKKYGREIKTLDQIPDEELDILARWGFTGLWLIGLWERSKASQRIKQLCGNPDAAPSAYSLYDYVIASELGGEAAFQNLRDRAWQRAIRLETDMVLNHMGIDSRWVVDHPDWFIQLDYPPFPAYTFNGPDLS
ncbi:MAG: alpha-amylase family glycosyl hydrolase, partial [Thermoplasmata archaeon]